MEEYKSNSHKARAERAADVPEKKVEKVVSGPVKVKKKSGLSKAAGMIISEDAGNVGSYVVMEVLVPAIKKAVKDIVTDGIEILLYGEPRRDKRSGGINANYVNYSKYSSVDRRDSGYRSEPRNRLAYDDIVVDTRAEAEEVLSQMAALIDQYGVASIADLCDLVGIQHQYTDNKYGWTNIRNAEPVRVSNGWLLKMPKVLPID